LVSSNNVASDLYPGHPPTNFLNPISIILLIIIIIIFSSAALSGPWSPQAMSPATSLLGNHSQFLQTNFHHHYHHHHHYHTRLGIPVWALVSSSNVASDHYHGHPPANFYNPVSLRLHLPSESILVSVGHVLDDLHLLSETSFIIFYYVPQMLNYLTNYHTHIIVIKHLNAQNLVSQ
jgi:hypothetical protein